jgi:hypothetical protein
MEEVMQFRVKLLSSTALAAVAALAASSVSAQDVGALEKRVQALEKSGSGQYVARSKKTMNLVISGHVNQMITFRDNGRDSGVFFSGNDQSETRFRFVGTGKITDDLTAKTMLEFGDDSGNGQNLDTNNDAGLNDQAAFVVRQMEVSIASKTIGTFALGDSSVATDGMHVAGDMSGMGIIQDSGDEGLYNGENFKNAATGAVVQNLAASFSNLDGGRTDHIEYATPTFAGFQAVASMGNQDQTNFGLKYGGDFGGVKVKAGIAYDQGRVGPLNGDTDTINGSIGVLLPMGLNFFVSAADRKTDTGGVDEDRIYARIGYMFTATELGQTRLGLAWGQHEDRALKGDEAERWSLAIVQVVEPLGAELYAGYHNWSLDRPGVSIDDIDVVTAGMRISF